MHGHGVKQDPHGNLFEGEWKEGKPIIKGEDAGRGSDFLAWVNEAVGSTGTQRKNNKDYSSVSTHDDD